MHAFLRIVFISSVLLALCSPTVDARELLVVGTHFPRIFERTPEGAYVGLGADVVRQVAKQSGDTARFEIYPWARAQAMVEQGIADVLVGPYKTPDRELRFPFSERAFYQDRMQFFVKKGSALSWDGDYTSLRGKRIAAINGWAYGALFDQARTKLFVSNAATVENGLNMLTHDHVDMLATNWRNTEAAVRALNMVGKVVPVERVIDVQDGYFAFSKKTENEGLRQRFNYAFNSMIERGELARLARKLDVNIP
jgi:polar amino acid transport system substrate-binding protein